MKNYNVNYIDNNKLILTGKGEDILWDKAEILTDFVSPWVNEKQKRTEFKALWDKANLYCSFKVEDPEVYIDTADNTQNSINNSDRVELFFRTDGQLNPYYCLEIDPTPRLMDFKAKPNKDFDFNWNWPKNDILIKSDIQKEFFTVEIAISLASLTQFGLLKDGKIETGIYRAKYNEKEDLSFEPTWISWVNPQTETPNFHLPSSFGALNLKKSNINEYK